MTGCLFNQLVYCMAILPTKQVKIFTVIYYIMPIPCNDMVNLLKTPISGDPAVSCGSLRYPTVIRLTPVFVYRDKIRNVGFILSKPYGQIDFPMCPGI